MIQRMLDPNAESACELARETGVSQTTLSRWLRTATTVNGMAKNKQTPPRRSRPTENPDRRPKDWSPEEKLQAVLEASQIPDEDLGSWLRSKGLYKADIDAWRRVVFSALAGEGKTKKKSAGSTKASKELRALRRELERKDKALAETAALLVLKKKVQAIWGDEDDATPGKKGS
jgi:transposase-like protein